MTHLYRQPLLGINHQNAGNQVPDAITAHSETLGKRSVVSRLPHVLAAQREGQHAQQQGCPHHKQRLLCLQHW